MTDPAGKVGDDGVGDCGGRVLRGVGDGVGLGLGVALGLAVGVAGGALGALGEGLGVGVMEGVGIGALGLGATVDDGAGTKVGREPAAAGELVG